MQQSRSNLNPTLTQLAKTRRAVFVEGLDFQILSPLARMLGMQRLANRADFAVIQTQGFNPKRAIDLAAGIEKTTGGKILRAVILDRDYRSDDEILEVKEELSRNGFYAHIHTRKEIENYLLTEVALRSALKSRLQEKARRSGKPIEEIPDVVAILDQCMESVRHDVLAQLISRSNEFKKRSGSSLDAATVTAGVSRDFEHRWGTFDGRLAVVPGKEVLAKLNNELQARVGVSLTDAYIARHFTRLMVPEDLLRLVSFLEDFSRMSPPD